MAQIVFLGNSSVGKLTKNLWLS